MITPDPIGKAICFSKADWEIVEALYAAFDAIYGPCFPSDIRTESNVNDKAYVLNMRMKSALYNLSL